MPLGKTLGLNLTQTWAHLFIENEKKKRRFSDIEIVKRMEEEFPDKKGKSTVTRVYMFRILYNKGTGVFKSYGASGSKRRPLSVRYTKEGEPLQPYEHYLEVAAYPQTRERIAREMKKKLSKKKSKKKLSKKKAGKKMAKKKKSKKLSKVSKAKK